MASSTKRSGKNRSLKRGNHAKKSSCAKTSSRGSSSSPSPTRSELPTGEPQLTLNINGSWTGIIRSLQELTRSTALLYTKQLTPASFKRALRECEDSPMLKGSGTRFSLSQAKLPCPTSSSETLSSHLGEAFQRILENDPASFSRSMIASFATFMEQHAVIKLQPTLSTMSLRRSNNPS